MTYHIFLKRKATKSTSATLIPFIYILSFSSLGLHFIKVNIVMFGTALILIIASIAGFYKLSSRNKDKTYRTMGFVTLVPALISIFFSFVSEKLVISFIAKFVPGFVENMIQDYIALIVPRLTVLTGLYFVIGMVLLVLGYRSKI